MTSGIYLIKNATSGRVYVGSALRIERRFNEHRSTLRRGKHRSQVLQRAWNKYGEEDFTFEIVADESRLIEREQWWIDDLKSTSHANGFNICAVAGRTVGRPHTEETKAKIAAKATGRILSEETKAKMSVARKGQKRSMEVRARMSAAAKKRPPKSAETIEKHRLKLLGKPGHRHTAESRAKISASNVGKHSITPENRAKMLAGISRRCASL